MRVQRSALAGVLGLGATLFVIMCLQADDSTVVKEWIPTGQVDMPAAISAAHALDDEVKASDAEDGMAMMEDLQDNVPEKAFEMEDSAFDAVEDDLNLIQVDGAKRSDGHEYGEGWAAKKKTAKETKQDVVDWHKAKVAKEKAEAVKRFGAHHFAKKFVAVKQGANYFKTQKGQWGATFDFSNEGQAGYTMPKELPATGLERNCVSLRAYARAISHGFNTDKTNGADLSAAGGGDSLNVLQDILVAMAKPTSKGATCAETWKAIIKPLQANKNWQVPNGIAQDMLKSINHEMHNKRGILAFQDAKSLQPLSCEDKGLSLNRAAECKALMESRKHGKFVLIDASRVGWSGQPEIFTRLAVRVSTYLRAVRAVGAKDADIVQNRHKAVAIAETKISDQAQRNLWKGMCQPRAGESKAKCNGKAKEACRTHASCKWLPGWQGQEFAEEEFLE